MTTKPKASSTPKIVDITGRPRIGGNYDESIQSPILTFEKGKLDFNSEDEKSDSYNNIDSEDETDESKGKEYNINKTLCNCMPSFSVAAVIIMVISLIFLHSYDTIGDEGNMELSLENLSKEFPSQIEDFWLHVQLGIQEITKFHQPKTFLLLYNDESYNTTNEIWYKISKFAVCKLTNCSAVPVVLEGNELNTTYILEDYGRVISQYETKVKESGVMIVKNLDKIPGISAQAFHSFCDEYNPVVQKALFIFTMKVEAFHENNVKLVEHLLHSLWKNDMRDDTFYPLFTRISSNILPIMAER